MTFINTYEYEYELARQLEALKLSIQARPLVLGGTASYSGGIGGPTGGFIGYLPQGMVAGDYSEAEDNTLPISGATLLDNLNRIRYRIGSLENGSNLIIKEDGSIVASGVVILDFIGAGIDVIPSGVIVTISGGSGGGSFLTLSDTPASYSGQAGKALIVNLEETAIEFATISGLGGGAGISDNIILFHAGESTEYTADTTGLTNALSASTASDIVILPANTAISGNFTLPAGITLKGSIDKSSRINGTLALSINKSGYSTRIENLTLYHDSNNYSLQLACSDVYQNYAEIIENCDFIVDDGKFAIDASYVSGDWTDQFYINCLFGAYNPDTGLLSDGEVFYTGGGNYMDGYIFDCKLGGTTQWSDDTTSTFTQSDRAYKVPFIVKNFKKNETGITTWLTTISGTDTRYHIRGLYPDYEVFRIKKDGTFETKQGVIIGNTTTDLPNAGELWFAEKTSIPTGTTNYIKLINVSGMLLGIDENNNQYQIIPPSGGGGSSFLGLSDTPSSYSGQAGKAVIVNQEETGTSFATISGVSGSTDVLMVQVFS